MVNDIELVIPIPIDFPSLNKFYASKHWGYRKGQKLKFFKYLESLEIKCNKQYADNCFIYVENYTRMDTDNVVMLSKFTADFLKQNGFIKDDSNRIYTDLYIRSVKPTTKELKAIITVQLTWAKVQ